MNRRAKTDKKPNLTKKQQKLIEELEEICSILSVDFYNIENYEKESRTVYLELAKNKLIRSQIIVSYTWIDEALSSEICIYFFGSQKSFQQLWRTKKFQNFNHFIIDELSLLQKLKFVRAIVKIPRKIISDIERLNSLRNGIVHSFFPKQRRIHKPLWKGKDIFTLQGINLFDEDMNIIYDFFAKRILYWREQ